MQNTYNIFYWLSLHTSHNLKTSGQQDKSNQPCDPCLVTGLNQNLSGTSEFVEKDKMADNMETQQDSNCTEGAVSQVFTQPGTLQPVTKLADEKSCKREDSSPVQQSLVTGSQVSAPEDDARFEEEGNNQSHSISFESTANDSAEIANYAPSNYPRKEESKQPERAGTTSSLHKEDARNRPKENEESSASKIRGRKLEQQTQLEETDQTETARKKTLETPDAASSADISESNGDNQYRHIKPEPSLNMTHNGPHENEEYRQENENSFEGRNSGESDRQQSKLITNTATLTDDVNNKKAELNDKRTNARESCEQMGYKEEEIQQAVNIFQNQNGSTKDYCASDLAEIIEEKKEDKPPDDPGPNLSDPPVSQHDHNSLQGSGQYSVTATIRDGGHPNDGSPHVIKIELPSSPCDRCLRQNIKFDCQFP